MAAITRSLCDTDRIDMWARIWDQADTPRRIREIMFRAHNAGQSIECLAGLLRSTRP